MNKQNLKTAAMAFEQAYQQIDSPPVDVTNVYNALKPLIKSSIQERIDTPIPKESVPGNYQFNEGAFQPFPVFEDAYLTFRTALKGGLTSKEKALLDKIKNL